MQDHDLQVSRDACLPLSHTDRGYERTASYAIEAFVQEFPLEEGSWLSADSADYHQISVGIAKELEGTANQTLEQTDAVAQPILTAFDFPQMVTGQCPAVGHTALDFMESLVNKRPFTGHTALSLMGASVSQEPAVRHNDFGFMESAEGENSASEQLYVVDIQPDTTRFGMLSSLVEIDIRQESAVGGGREGDEFLAGQAGGVDNVSNPNRSAVTSRKRRPTRELVKDHQVVKQWDEEKNGQIPDGLTCSSHKNVWWTCENGHSGKALVKRRCNFKNPSGCPICVGRSPPVRRFVKDHPAAYEWDVEKNGGPIPENLSCGSHKKVWWTCKKGHSRQRLIRNHCKGKELLPCPTCTEIPYVRGLLKNHSVAEQWDEEKNGGPIPEGLTCGSKKKFWWKCEMNHGWQAFVSRRCSLKNPSGCPTCTGRSFVRRFVKDHPAADQWDELKNGGPIPEDLTCGSHRKFWWKCKDGSSQLKRVSNCCQSTEKLSGSSKSSKAKAKKRPRTEDSRVKQPSQKKKRR